MIRLARNRGVLILPFGRAPVPRRPRRAGPNRRRLRTRRICVGNPRSLRQAMDQRRS